MLTSPPTYTPEEMFNNPASLAEKRFCDLCANQDYLSDMFLCADGNGYYCEECIKSGDVESYLIRKTKLTPDQIVSYITNIKL